MSSIGAGAPVGRRTAADEGRCTAGADDGTVPVPRVTVGEAQAPCGIKKRTLQRVNNSLTLREGQLETTHANAYRTLTFKRIPFELEASFQKGNTSSRTSHTV